MLGDHEESGVMAAGYSGYPGRSQAAKLGLKPDQRVVLDEPPPGWGLADPPAGLADADPDGSADVIVAFFTTAGDLARRLEDLARRIYPAGALWVAWPRRATGHRSDITENLIREHALPIGVVDVKVAAIDNDWSGLRLVWRVQNRLSWAGRGVAWAAWVSLDAEERFFLAWRSGSRSSSSTSWLTGARARRCRLSGTTWG
jgi:hypothetical protein